MNKQSADGRKPVAPGKEDPMRARGYSGRGAASALETLKRLEKVRPKPEDTARKAWE
jgi:hypothetical protein